MYYWKFKKEDSELLKCYSFLQQKYNLWHFWIEYIINFPAFPTKNSSYQDVILHIQLRHFHFESSQHFELHLKGHEQKYTLIPFSFQFYLEIGLNSLGKYCYRYFIVQWKMYFWHHIQCPQIMIRKNNCRTYIFQKKVQFVANC